MKMITFYKYQGTGNDFILLDNRDNSIKLSPEQIEFMCNRNKGIGADGLMILENDETHDFYMRYYNADSSEVAMCGNGGRCITLFAHHLGIFETTTTFNSMDGVHTADVITDDGQSGVVKIKLIDVNEVRKVGSDLFLNTGVPHLVRFVQFVGHVDVDNEGRQIRYDEQFKDSGGTNANFLHIVSEGEIDVRTYERGVEGETLACGTGATAAAIATSFKYQPHMTSFKVNVLGGVLKITFNKVTQGEYNNIELEGAAKLVFKGEIEL